MSLNIRVYLDISSFCKVTIFCAGKFLWLGYDTRVWTNRVHRSLYTDQRAWGHRQPGYKAKSRSDSTLRCPSCCRRSKSTLRPRRGQSNSSSRERVRFLRTRVWPARQTRRTSPCSTPRGSCCCTSKTCLLISRCSAIRSNLLHHVPADVRLTRVFPKPLFLSARRTS